MKNPMRFLIVIAILAAPASFPLHSIADVVAQWHFNESSGGTTLDSVGSIDGVLAGDAAFTAGGISGNAISMTRSGNGYVDMGDNFGFTSGDFSIVSWVKLANNDTTSDYFIAGKHRSTQVRGYLLTANMSGGSYGQDGKAYFYDSNGSPGDEPISTTTINDGNWHQIVGVYSAGGLAAIYVDGAGVEDSKPVDTINAVAASFLIGGISSAGGTPTGFLNGSVDEVQLYDQALTSSQIQFLFENPSLTIAVPEPGSLGFIILGLTGLLSFQRRKR